METPGAVALAAGYMPDFLRPVWIEFAGTDLPPGKLPDRDKEEQWMGLLHWIADHADGGFPARPRNVGERLPDVGLPGYFDHSPALQALATP